MKHLSLLVILFLLVGCGKAVTHVYSDDKIDDFDKILTNIGDGNTKAYDLRSEEVCILGRIPGFFCVRTTNNLGEEKTLDMIFEHLTLLVGDDYQYLIILIDDDGDDSAYLADLLVAAGYKNVHYFENGYDRYAEIKKDSFVPETGPCETC